MSEVVAEFIYKTSNPIIVEMARENGDIAYINSYKAKAGIPAWRRKFEETMNNYTGEKFTFKQLETWVINGEIQPRYYNITNALYESLKNHYM